MNQEALDKQDKLFMAYPKELDSLYQTLQKVLGGRDPSATLVVSRFKDTYPELYKKLYTD